MSSDCDRERRVELNIDLGEFEEEPEEFYALCTVANVALGGHAGNESTLLRAVARARRAGVRVAAHPSYPDRAHFGRRSLALAEPALRGALRSQFEGFAAALGAEREASFVKAHGALYHDVAKHSSLARLFVAVAVEVLGEDTGFVGLADSSLAVLCESEGRSFAREGFADRAVDAAGRLVPRTSAGALLAGERALERALVLAESGLVDTICLHGDSEGALATARLVREGLGARGWLRG